MYVQGEICINIVLLDWLLTAAIMTISLASSGTKLRRLLNHLDSESKAVARKKPQPVNRESSISMFTSLGGDAIQAIHSTSVEQYMLNTTMHTVQYIMHVIDQAHLQRTIETYNCILRVTAN